MKTFLQLVANDLYNKIGNDLSRTAIVFPNKRAGLFFNEYLAQESDVPLWSPAYVSISELFQQLSPLKLGDPIRLVCQLYKVFCQQTGSTETLDDFYFWGELLISDFDDVDKHRVDADKLFGNLRDLKTLMDDYDFLDKDQEEAIRQFFHNFSVEKRTQLKEKFLSLWDKLGDIYHYYRRNLRELGIAYEGMLYRDVIDRLPQALDQLPYERYVFVGFNVLNQVEHHFFRLLKDQGKALFYWDYDLAYTQAPLQGALPYSHEAGEFILRNLDTFPNELPASCFDALNQPKQVTYIAASTENAQAHYLPQWIQSVYPDAAPVCEKENAVVLCNEALLLPVLHSIPPQVKNVNITMGFPLAQTPAYSFLNALIDLQTDGYNPDTGRYGYEAVLTVLKHPYTRQLSATPADLEQQLTRNNRFYPLPSELKTDPILELIFTPQTGTAALCRYLARLLRQATVIYRQEEDKEKSFNQLYRESLFKSFTLVNRLNGLIDAGDLTGIRTATFKRLLTRILTSTHIPFHGEPAIGLQVMGVLETRNLNFRNLILLSLNEGQLPKGTNDSSFIPYNLRKGFGMTTPEHKNAVYAYYFYRLIQRAENITLVYNTSSDGLNRGEMSRFMLQFLVEWPHPIRQCYLDAGQSPQLRRTLHIDKTEDVWHKLVHTFDHSRQKGRLLSPSALNAYLDCPLLFYYRYVAGLQVPDEVSPEIDSALFGTLFHKVAENIYTDLTAHGKMVQKDDIEQLLKSDVRLRAYVDDAFRTEFFHVQPDERPEYNGTQLINARVIAFYIRQLLRNDLRYAPFAMEGMEQHVEETLQIDTPHGPVTLRIGGTIDRLDSKEGMLRIVDYKTGGSPKSPVDVEQLFLPADDRPGYIFQTFLYATIVQRQHPGSRVAPALLYIHRAASDTYSPVIEMGPPRKKSPVDNIALYEDEFRSHLHELLAELFHPDIPFEQTEDEKRCAYCDYRHLCKR